MKRVRINQGKTGLVIKNGNYAGILTEGVYWISPMKQVIQYDMTKPFSSHFNLDLLLKDPKFTELIHLVEVGDKNIVFLYENKNYKCVLQPGRYAYWKGIIAYDFKKADLKETEIDESFDRTVLERSELIPYVRIFSVESYEKGLLYVNGKFSKELDAGNHYFWKNATKIEVQKTDLRRQQMEISGQEILSKDKANLRINFYTQYKVVDVMKALNDNKDYSRQLYILIQLALREYIGTQSLDEILENKDSVSEYVTGALREKSQALGIEILDNGVRDIILPGDIKDIMNQVLVVQKQAQANLIMRREETASTRSLLNTARLLEENEMLYKLKEMEYVEKIADKINSITLSGGNKVLSQLKDLFSGSN